MITLGADPELFLMKDGSPVTPKGLIQGSKKFPQPVNNGSIQMDGTAAEFNIDPSFTPEQFSKNIDEVLNQLLSITDCTYDTVVTRHWGVEALSKMSRDEVELGCDPDYNAYTLKKNPRPSSKVDFRTAGGHIHVGFVDDGDESEGYKNFLSPLVKILDEQIGVPSLFWDGDKERRTLYGKAGAYRPKPFGVEYRSLSNAWVPHVDVREFLFEQAEKSVRLFQEGYVPETCEAQNIIDNNDMLAAHIFCNKKGIDVDDIRR